MSAPAKVVRELSPEQAQRLRQSAENYIANAARHRAGLRRVA